jgi:sterol desaturase/sphingolipid hydroxylase (fatty acid hydroxylase superfamily)
MFADLSWIIFAGSFVEQAVRYVLPAAMLALALAVAPALRRLRIQRTQWKMRDMWRDFAASLSFAAFAGAVAIPLGFAQMQGATLLYRDVIGHGFGPLLEWAYLPISFVLLLVVHDAYFYWTHRLMHVREIFRVAHVRHHRARTPSVWTAFAFHPVESLIQLGIYPLIAFLIPVHMSVFSLFLLVTALHSALIHCGHDLLLDGDRGWLSRWLYTTVDHDAHHHRGRGAYALYFGVWDAWMGTRAELCASSAEPAIERAA